VDTKTMHLHHTTGYVADLRAAKRIIET